jgi:hypothetical protein
MNDPTILMIIMLVVVALMMSRDTHKLFAETTRTWAQFGSSNYKAISALTAAVIVATIGRDVYKNKLLIEELEAILAIKQARQEATLGIQQAWKGSSRYLANRESARQQNMESARRMAKMTKGFSPNKIELEKLGAQQMQAQRESVAHAKPSILEKFFSLYDFGG